MIIERIKLHNFRSYFGEQTIELSDGLTPDKNIIAIGGLNGAGKTSLIDAVTFGLLGEAHAFEFVKKKQRKGDDRRAIERELNGLINREALASGKREASVTIFVRDNEGQRFVVERTWEYGSRGEYRRERLLVVRPGGPSLEEMAWEDDEDLTHAFEDFLNNHVPARVAGFFFFDGEEIQRIARDEPQDAVRQGIELLLGFHLLDALSSDMDVLQDRYKNEARKRTQQEEQLDKLILEEKQLDNQHRQIEEEMTELEERGEKLREENRKLVDELSSVFGGGGTDPKLLQDELDKTNQSIQKARGALLDAVEHQIIPGLAGNLVRRLSSQLDGEDARAQWEEGKLRVQPQREKLLTRIFGPTAPAPEPPLLATQQEFLRIRMRDEWDNLFNPPPPGIADVVRHSYLTTEERMEARSKCNEILRSGSVDVGRLLTEIEILERRARDLRLSLERIGDGELAAKLIADKTRIDREIGEIQATWDDRKRQLSAVQVELRQKRQEVSDKRAELRGSGKYADRAELARRVKKAVELYKEALRPRKRDELATHLGTMYRHLARKEDVIQRIELDERTFTPKLLDRRGNAIPLDSQSAGEREIYALSLLWALGKTSRRDLPVLIDTPLARLDSAHRKNIVTRYLPHAGSQVIVLSTDTEIDRRHFDFICDNIAASHRLEFDPMSERTSIRAGYFDFH